MMHTLNQSKYIDLLTLDTVKELGNECGGIRVSLYMPSDKVEETKNFIRFKNLFQDLENFLDRGGMRMHQRIAFMKPLRDLLMDAAFWRYQDRGLALYYSQDFLRTYRLPLPFEPTVTVDERFHLKPVLSMFAGDELFYLLALSREDVRLYQATRFGIGEVEVPGMPRTVDEALMLQKPDRALQFHTGTPGMGSRGPRSAVFHGQRTGRITRDEQVLEFFKKIDRTVYRKIGAHSVPLVIAGLREYHHLYRETNSYYHLIENGVVHNPFDIPENELHRRAWEIVRPSLDRERADRVEKYFNLRDTGMVSNRIEQVLPDAFAGRVDTLFVRTPEEVSGSFDPETMTVDRTSDSDDLLDLALIYTVERKGTVYTNQDEVLADSPVAAVYRY